MPIINSRNRYKKVKFSLLAVSLFFVTAIPSPSMATLKATKKHKISPQVTNLSNAIMKAGYHDFERSPIIAQHIYDEAKKNRLDPKLLVAIIMVESGFDQGAVSTTGDISLAQINVTTWNEEFKRLNRELLDKKRLKRDSHYAITRMAEILSILAIRHKTKKDWFGYYHSGTPEYKNIYVKKINRSLAQINSVQLTSSMGEF